MKKLLPILTLVLAIIHAPNLVEISAVADEHRPRAGDQDTGEVVGEDQRTHGVGERSDRQAQARQAGEVEAVVTGESAPNPKFPSYNQTATGSTTAKEPVMQDGCPCGPDCKCPDLRVCEHGNCKKNYVIFFSASWCGPCKQMYPRIEELRATDYIVYFFDIDKFPNAAKKFNVASIPTTVVMDNGKEVARFVGVVDKGRIMDVTKTRSEQNDPDGPFDYKFTD